MSELDPSSRWSLVEQMSKCESTFLHDIRNPLTAIRILSDVLLQEAQDPEFRQDLMDIVQSADQAALLLEGMSDFGMGRLMERSATRAPFSMAAIAQEVAQRPGFGGRIELNVKQNLEDALDGANLGRALCDVVSFLLRIAEPKEPIQMVVDCEQDEVVFIMTGPPPGVPESLRHAMIQPFGALVLRAHQIPAPSFGLAAAHAYFTRNGGGVQVDETAEGGLSIRCSLMLSRSRL